MTDTKTESSAFVATGDTPMAQVLKRMFPRGMLMGEQNAGLVQDYRYDKHDYAEMCLYKQKTVPVDGLMLATVSTIGLGQRCRWFLMEVGEVYIAIKMTPAAREVAQSSYVESVRCVAAAMTVEEKSWWKSNFETVVAELNSQPVASFYPGRGH